MIVLWKWTSYISVSNLPNGFNTQAQRSQASLRRGGYVLSVEIRETIDAHAVPVAVCACACACVFLSVNSFNSTKIFGDPKITDWLGSANRQWTCCAYIIVLSIFESTESANEKKNENKLSGSDIANDDGVAKDDQESVTQSRTKKKRANIRNHNLPFGLTNFISLNFIDSFILGSEGLIWGCAPHRSFS